MQLPTVKILIIGNVDRDDASAFYDDLYLYTSMLVDEELSSYSSEPPAPFFDYLKRRLSPEFLTNYLQTKLSSDKFSIHDKFSIQYSSFNKNVTLFDYYELGICFHAQNIWAMNYGKSDISDSDITDAIDFFKKPKEIPVVQESFIVNSTSLYSVTRPSNPITGAMYFDTFLNKFKLFDGSKWIDVNSGPIWTSGGSQPNSNKWIDFDTISI